MKQLKELWTLVNNWLGNGKKCIIGLVFFLVGFVMNWFSHPVEGLSQIPFTLMTAGGLCLVNALFSKWTDKNINLLFFVLAFICVMDLGIVLHDGYCYLCLHSFFMGIKLCPFAVGRSRRCCQEDCNVVFGNGLQCRDYGSSVCWFDLAGIVKSVDSFSETTLFVLKVKKSCIFKRKFS